MHTSTSRKLVLDDDTGELTVIVIDDDGDEAEECLGSIEDGYDPEMGISRERYYRMLERWEADRADHARISRYDRPRTTFQGGL